MIKVNESKGKFKVKLKIPSGPGAIKKLFKIIFITILVVVAFGLSSTAIFAGGGFAGNWPGQETFTINSVLGGPPDSSVMDIPIIATSDGTVYTSGSSAGGTRV